MGFININSLPEPATNVTSNNYYQHLMELCYNLWSNIISILSCTGNVYLFSSPDCKNVTCNSVGLPASEIIHAYFYLLLLSWCSGEKVSFNRYILFIIQACITPSPNLLGYQFWLTSRPSSDRYTTQNLQKEPHNSPCISLGKRFHSLYKNVTKVVENCVKLDEERTVY